MTSADWKTLPNPTGWGPWSNTEQLLALVADRVAHLEFILVAINSDKTPREPTPVDRPGIGAPPWERQEQQRIAEERIALIIQYARDHQGAMPPGSWVPDSEVRLDHGRMNDGGDLDG